MTWTKVSDYAISNGLHNISKAIVGGKPRYTLWRLGSPDKILGFFDSSDEAKRNAESDQS